MGACILVHPRVLLCVCYTEGVLYCYYPLLVGGVPLKGFFIYVYCACFSW